MKEVRPKKGAIGSDGADGEQSRQKGHVASRHTPSDHASLDLPLRSDTTKARKQEGKEELARQKQQEELEAAKQASGVKCGMCGAGILDSNFFEAMGQKFCGTACVTKYRAASR